MFTFQALLARRQALFMLAALAGAGLSRAETEIYKTIDWNDLMPDPWVKEMTTEMAKMSKLNGLLDGSAEATKAMADSCVSSLKKLGGNISVLQLSAKMSSSFKAAPSAMPCISGINAGSSA